MTITVSNEQYKAGLRLLTTPGLRHQLELARDAGRLYLAAFIAGILEERAA